VKYIKIYIRNTDKLPDYHKEWLEEEKGFTMKYGKLYTRVKYRESLLPLSFFLNSLGYVCGIDGKNRTVYINSYIKLAR